MAAVWPARSRVRAERRNRHELLIRRDAACVTIKELDLDHEMGRIALTEYRALRDRYRAPAVVLLQEQDARPAREVSDRTPEQETKQNSAPTPRDRDGPGFYPRCSLPLQPEHRFRRRCGAALRERQA